MCFDMGYNTQAILVQLTQSIAWKDCYKNVINTFLDWSNWVGPKALWLDFCQFSSSQNMLLYSTNPWGISKSTGDYTFLKESFVNFYSGEPNPTAGSAGDIQRPTSSSASYYRDCFVLDDTYFSSTYWIFSLIGQFGALFQEYLPDMNSLLELMQSQTQQLDQEEVIMENDFTYTIGDAPILSQ